MIVFQMKHSRDMGIVTTDGELTAERTDELRSFLKRALDSVNYVVLDMKYVTEIDFSCLRLLCSVYRTALLMKKHFTITGGSPDLFAQAMESVDSEECTDCVSDRERCLWDVYFADELSMAW